MIEKGILGNAIKNSRIESGLSQEKLSELVDISPTHLKHIESEHRKPSLEVLFKLVKILNISLDNLLFTANNEIFEYHYAQLLLKNCTPKEIKLIIDIIKSIQNNREQEKQN